MFQKLVKLLKNVFGFGNDRRERKREFYRIDFDVSDEESDCEFRGAKRRKLSPTRPTPPSDTFEREPSYNTSMADWIKPRQKGFSNNYYFNKPVADRQTRVPQSRAPREPELVDLTDVSDDSRAKKGCHNLTSLRNPRLQPVTINKGNQAVPLTNGSQAHYLSERETLSARRKHRPKLSDTMKSSVKRGNTVAQCYRLEDKERYRKLLLQYNTSQQLAAPRYGLQTNGYTSTKKSTTTTSPRTLELRNGLGGCISRISGPSIPSTSRRCGPVMKEKLSEADRYQYKQNILGNGNKNVKKTTELGHQRIVSPEIQFIGTKKPSSAKTNVSSIGGVLADERSLDESVVIVEEVPKWKKAFSEMDGQIYDEKWLKSKREQFAAEEAAKSKQIHEAEKDVQVLKEHWEPLVTGLRDKMRAQLKISERDLTAVEEIFLAVESDEEDVEPLCELTPEMEDLIDDALCATPPEEVLVEEFRLQIRRRDMETLQDLNWLNDEVINFYMSLLMERGKHDNMPSVYACNTFFYPKLLSGGHVQLKRWTRKIDIFAHDKMLIPVHLGVHWCLAVVDFQSTTIKYYDSMGGTNNECLNALCEYLKAESLDKKKKKFDLSDWTIENAKDIPQQMNSSDCGMFACKYAEYITRNAKITFKQEHMPYFRRRMVYEIITKRLL